MVGHKPEKIQNEIETWALKCKNDFENEILKSFFLPPMRTGRYAIFFFKRFLFQEQRFSNGYYFFRTQKNLPHPLFHHAQIVI
jgi:hypothetical protein